MTERQSLEFKVSHTKEGIIVISQEDPNESDPYAIYIHPDQTDLLIKWINEVKAELQKD